MHRLRNSGAFERFVRNAMATPSIWMAQGMRNFPKKS
jgi:hypothetical protein